MLGKMKRRIYLVNKAVQLRYMGLVVAPLILLLAGLYYLMYYSVFSEMLIPEAIVATLLPAMKKVNVVLLVALPVTLYFITRKALIYSNRIVGPIPRLEKEIDRALAGDAHIRFKVRDKDELRTFISKVNLLLEKLEKAHSAS